MKTFDFNNRVRIDIVNGKYQIFCFNSNRYYSSIEKNNEYKPIAFKSYAEVADLCKESSYEIVNPLFK